MVRQWDLLGLRRTLGDLEIREGDLLFIHSSLGILGEGLDPETVIAELLKWVGLSGAIFFPSFSYSLGQGAAFDPLDSSNFNSMGVLSTVAFKQGFARSRDPIFSILGSPGVGSDLVRQKFADASFGPGSFFSHLVDRNAKVVNFGTGAGSTLIHELEFRLRVSYRYVKKFEGSSEGSPKNQESAGTWESFVRDLNDPNTEASFVKLSKRVIGESFYKTSILGRGAVSAYELLDMLDYLEATLSVEPQFLTVGGRVS